MTVCETYTKKIHKHSSRKRRRIGSAAALLLPLHKKRPAAPFSLFVVGLLLATTMLNAVSLAGRQRRYKFVAFAFSRQYHQRQGAIARREDPYLFTTIQIQTQIQIQIQQRGFPRQQQQRSIAQTVLSLSSSSSSSTTTTSDTTSINVIPETEQETNPPNERAQLLNACLDTILTPPSFGDNKTNNSNTLTVQNTSVSPSNELMDAALRSLEDPSSGYDPRYGRPALRCYRSFVYPKESNNDNNNNNNNNDDQIQLRAAAQRTANQIDFLVKRNTSQRLEAIRNHDDDPNNNNDNNHKKFPITLVLDNLRGSFNVGSIFRTAEACGVSKIYTCGITPHPHGSGAEKVAKSALGAEHLLESKHFATTQLALEELQDVFVVALETTSASRLYTNVDYRPHLDTGIALILGNEVTGVDAELLAPLLLETTKNDSNGNDDGNGNDSLHQQRRNLVDCIVELPTYGKKNSLNVAAVAPVILYELLRQWEN